RRRHTRSKRDWSSDVCSSDLLDVLPVAVAPAVSSPASYGVPLPLVSAVIDHVATSGKLVHADIAELNPSLDTANATAMVAARFRSEERRVGKGWWWWW